MKVLQEVNMYNNVISVQFIKLPYENTVIYHDFAFFSLFWAGSVQTLDLACLVLNFISMHSKNVSTVTYNYKMKFIHHPKIDVTKIIKNKRT